mgnify:CR=1 FL=1
MPIKGKLVSWYIKNILIPGQQKIEKPGFIVKSFDTGQYNRDILIPEDLIKEVEKEFKETLYKTGKFFGYRLGLISRLPRYPETSKKKFKKFAYFFTRYIESLYSSGIEEEIDFDNKLYKLNAKNYVVCRKNGLGYLFSSGGIAGIWSYVNKNEDIEGVQIKCEGRGDDHCEVICAPKEVLKNKNLDFNEAEIDEEYVKLSKDYKAFNKIREARHTENSLKDLMDIGFFEYSDGKISHNEKRYILSEASLVYFLGMECSKHEDGEDKLFKLSFDHGKQLAEGEDCEDIENFVQEYLSACGWGDTFIKKKDGNYIVYGYLFPWTRFWNETSFPIYRGIISGLLSGFKEENIILDKIEKDIKGEGFTVISSQS